MQGGRGGFGRRITESGQPHRPKGLRGRINPLLVHLAYIDAGTKISGRRSWTSRVVSKLDSTSNGRSYSVLLHSHSFLQS